MTVRIDTRGVLAAWRANDQQSLTVAFAPKGGSAPEALRDFRLARVRANEAARTHWHGESGTAFAAGEAWPGPHGPVCHASVADTREAVEGWLGVVSHELDAHGWSGTLRAEPSDFPEIFSHNQVALTAILAIEGWDTDERGRAAPAWSTDHEVARVLVEWARDFVSAGEDLIHVGQGVLMHRTPVDQVATRLAIPRLAHLVNSPDLNRVRAVRFDGAGRLIVQLRDTTLSWQERLSVMRNVLLTHAGSSQFGILRNTVAPAVSTTAALTSRPSRPPRSATMGDPRWYYQVHRHLDGDHVPDAHGIQVLTDAHVGRAHDLSRWKRTPIGGGKQLVEAPDLAPWYASDVPDATVLEQGRQDFGDMILWNEPPAP